MIRNASPLTDSVLRDPSRVRDAVVLGAGPAGSTVAALLAQQGHDVLVVEREEFPRHHVGESLIPAANLVLERLGVVDRLERSSFPRKHSVQFVGSSGKESEPFYFDDHDPLGRGYTWQVVRSEFDQMLSDRARELGAEVLTSCRVKGVEFRHEDPLLVNIHRETANRIEAFNVAARLVIDATGQSCYLANRLKLRQRDPQLRNGTVWTWFRGAQRGTGRDQGATIIFSSLEHKSWFWFIPLPNDVVSIGCTGSMDWMFKKGQTAEQVFQRELDRCPALKRRLVDAQPIEPIRSTKDFSYRSSECAGDRWVLIGDAYGFIDPVYSSGVFLAMKSAEMAADVIDGALKDNDLSPRRLGSWKQSYDAGVEHFRKLVYAFYDPDFSFAEFIAQQPEYRNDLTDLLVGNVFKPGAGRMFQSMKEVGG